MKNRSQNVMCFNSRILSITLLFLAMLVVSPRYARAQPGIPNFECVKTRSEILVELDRLEELAFDRGLLSGRLNIQPDDKEAKLKSNRLNARLSREKIQRLLTLLEECCCPKETSKTEEPQGSATEKFRSNQAVGLFSVIREDSEPERFNTYGVNGAYTRVITPSVGITGDFNAHSRELNGMDLSKLSALGGVTLLPFEGAKTTDKATVSLHALVGFSRFKADSGVGSSTDTAATVKLGGALDVNLSNNFFFRLGQVDYAPTRFGGETQHNFQVGFG